MNCKKVILDLDDFSVLRNRMDLLTTLKDHYPNFKVSMFTIPFDAEYETSMLRIERDKALTWIHNNLDWIEIIPHGLTHIPREFEAPDKETVEMAFEAIQDTFENDGLPYVNGFKAPQWLWNKEVVDWLDENNWWGAVDRNQPEMLTPKRHYVYDYSIHEPFWESDKEVLKLHGHMSLPSENNLEDCITNLFKLPNDVEFEFVSQHLNEKKN